MLVITSQLSNILRADLCRINPAHFNQLKSSIETYLLLKIEANTCRITNQNNPTFMEQIRGKKIAASSNIEAVQGKQVLIKLKEYLKSFKGVLDKDNTPEALKRKSHREAIIKTIVATSFSLPLDPYQPEPVQEDVWQRLQVREVSQNPSVQDPIPEPEPKKEESPIVETNYWKVAAKAFLVFGAAYTAYTYRNEISTAAKKVWDYCFPSDSPASTIDNQAPNPLNTKKSSKANPPPTKTNVPSPTTICWTGRLKDHVNAYLGMTGDGIKSAWEHFINWSKDKKKSVKFDYETYRGRVIELLKSGLTLKQIHDKKIISDCVYYYIVSKDKIGNWIRSGVLPPHK